MKRLKNCVYCGKPILEISKEHVIQNAIGGLYESEDICCKDCNNYISKYIDAPFMKIFKPIVTSTNIVKTHNIKLKSICKETAILYKVAKCFILTSG